MLHFGIVCMEGCQMLGYYMALVAIFYGLKILNVFLNKTHSTCSISI